MILRRVIEHVRAQNWTAVALDFVIVVLGVFMGIQLGNWNEARQADERAGSYLARLSADLSDNVEGLQARIEYWGHVATYGRRALEYVESDKTDNDVDPWPLLLAFFSASQTNQYRAIDTTHDELKSAGEMSLIRDAQLRGDLSAYYELSASRADLFYGLNPPYRDLIRGVMPLYFQDHYWAECYDLASDLSKRAQQVPCENVLGDDEAQALLARIVGRPAVIEALRSWVVNMQLAIMIAEQEKAAALALLERVNDARASP
ncbi:MAG: hypothetical protein AAF668_02730 [Pseudomonadota bacterium]